MIRTLKFYLGRDLAKATALAAVAFTLVMTVFALIEPLRERGLSSLQALKLFGFSMPVMVSLTLPVAALFAATIVYGRFSQDNELMACRASGICTLSLLGPAIWLGVIVSLVTLSLGLYVAPRLLWLSQHTIKNNLRRIAFYGLKSKGYVEFERRILHADRVDEKTGYMAGVVALDGSDLQDPLYLVADGARLQFRQRGDKTFWIFQPNRGTVRRQSGRVVFMLERDRIQHGRLPDLIEDNPKLYDWAGLLRARRRPQDCGNVRKQVNSFKRKVCMFMFYEDLIGAVQARGGYGKLVEFAPAGQTRRRERIDLKAPSAVLHRGREVVLASAPAGGESAERVVFIPRYRGDRYWARQAVARVEWDGFHGANLVTLLLKDVCVQHVGEPSGAVLNVDDKEIGPFAVPAEIVRAAEQIDLGDLKALPKRYGFGVHLVGMVASLDASLQRLLAKVSAEMHLRVAYGVSCLLMVMLGAALGLLLRGGQVLAAFAISAVPALLVIVVLVMGKELIKNPGVRQVYGVATIWSGVGALALVTAYMYLVLMRR